MSDKPEEEAADRPQQVASDTETISASMEDAEAAPFSLEVLHKSFEGCMRDEGVLVHEYILGYKELYKFLTMLGTVFGWVASDVKSKTDILHKYRTGDKAAVYTTVKGMIDYEVENKMIKIKSRDDPSGSRTLLRLHRALEYISKFLGDLQDLPEEEKCAGISREAYEATLMKYHPWVVQKAAKVAMGLLPTKKGLIHKLVPDGDPDELKKVHEDFPKAVESMKRAYQAIEGFYAKHNLLDIP